MSSSYTVLLHSDKYSKQVDGTSPSSVSRSGQPIRYSPPTNYSLIGYDAPTLADVAAGRKRKMTSTKKRPRKLKVFLVILRSLHRHQTSTPQQMLFLLHQKVIDNFQPFFLIVMHTLPIISFGIPKHNCQRYRRGRRPRDCFSNISDSSGISLVLLITF